MNTIFISSGHGQGKTTTLLNLANELIERGQSVTGVIERAFVVNGHRVAYFFESLPEHEFFMAARRRHFEPRLNAFEFFESAFKRAGRLITREADYKFADELGLLEAEGRGLWPAVLESMHENRARTMMLGVRGDHLEIFARRLLIDV